MSISPTVTEAPVVPSLPVHLRLVPSHEHAWRLLSVEFDEGLEVRCYECSGCRDVQYR